MLPIGIKLNYLKEFIQTLDEDFFRTATTAEVCQRKIIPATAVRLDTYCGHLKVYQPHAVGKANAFISHSWRFKFIDLCNALLYFFRDDHEAILWIDIFSNNQHSSCDKPLDWWTGMFKNTIKEIKRTVMVFIPWNDPEPLRRSWCVWELFCTIQEKCRFDVAMDEENNRRFLTAITNSHGFEDYFGEIDCERSEATIPRDRELIFQAISQGIGFVRLNRLIREFMKNWTRIKSGREVNPTLLWRGVSDIDVLAQMSGISNLYKT